MTALLHEAGSLWYVPTVATDAFPLADHTSTATLASSVFASGKSGVKLDGWAVTDLGAGTATVIFKDAAGTTLISYAAIASAQTAGSNQTRMFGPNGLDMGTGFSVIVGVDANARIIVWYRLPPQ